MERKPNYLSTAIILAIGLIIAAYMLSSTWRGVSRSNVTITVTGSASKNIRSDLAKWSGSYSHESTTLTDAYDKLKKDMDIVKQYLIDKGFEADKLIFSSVNTSQIYGKNMQGYSTDEVIGYKLSQTVSLESGDVDKIDKLSRESSELILQGVNFDSHAPEFLYTKLSDLKIEMISLAAQDAKLRAEQIAKSTGDDIGDVRSSKTGVMQINAKNSTEVSDYGINDVSSLEKTITAVVNMSFTIK
jgi:hypothetical protein